MSNNILVDSGRNLRQQWLPRRKLKLGLRSNRKRWRISKGLEYLPLMSDDVSDEEVTVHDSSLLELRQRNSQKNASPNSDSKTADGTANGEASSGPKECCDPLRNCELVNLNLKDGDSLHSISVKYRCPISDIKRANNLISDQDFYALRQVKIPVRKHGILSQILSDPGPSEQSKAEDSEEHVRVINVGLMMSNNSPQEAAAFLKRMDEDLVKIMLNTKSQKDSLEEAAAALSEPRIQPLVKDPYSDVECGFQWSYLLACMLIIAVVVPLLIILYVYYVKTPNNHHNETFSRGSSSEPFSSSSKTSALDKT